MLFIVLFHCVIQESYKKVLATDRFTQVNQYHSLTRAIINLFGDAVMYVMTAAILKGDSRDISGVPIAKYRVSQLYGELLSWNDQI